MIKPRPKPKFKTDSELIKSYVEGLGLKSIESFIKNEIKKRKRK